MAGSGQLRFQLQTPSTQPKPATLQTTRALPREQAQRANLDANGVFKLITDDRFFSTIESHLPPHRERTFTPTETLAMFVAQVLSDDSSCQRAVDERIVRCIEHGLKPSSSSTAAYCETRARLPLSMIEALYKQVGQHASDSALPVSRWCGRRALFIDGTGATMPDTPENQQAYPQPSSQQSGIGFPEARLVALSCAATGAIVDATHGPAKGKATGELSQMRILARSLRPDDVLVGDALYETFWTFLMLQQRGCDGVFEINGSRSRPGPRCTRVTLKRPARPEWMDPETYRSSPRQIIVRQVLKRKRGYEPKVILTTLSDSKQFSDKQITKLFIQRWNVETDFRSLKCALDAGILSCRTPEMIEKELAVHLLAYNLTRLLMNEAAVLCGCEPRSISFRHTVQLWSTWLLHGCELDEQGWIHLLEAIAARRVGKRPGRREPRAVKRRPKTRPLLDMPRSAARSCCHLYER